MTQSEIVTKLLKRGFEQSHKHDTDTVYLSKRDWLGLKLAQVSPDGLVNGEVLSDYLNGGSNE